MRRTHHTASHEVSGWPGLALVLLVLAVRAKQQCECEKIALPAKLSRASVQEFVIPASIPTRELPRQLVLLKVPETGSSTAANLLNEIADHVGVPAWLSGSKTEFDKVVATSAKSAPKWSLGHYPYGDWIATHFDDPVLVTTARDPMARLASHTEKRAQRGEINCNRANERCSCDKGVGVAVKFWGVSGRNTLASAEETAKATAAKFDSIWITERYNESLVAFAVAHRLRLGDVLPPLAKYHKPHEHVSGESQPLRARIRAACEQQASKATDLELERRVYELASARLDDQLRALTVAGVEAYRLVSSFSEYLDATMSLGKSRKSSQKHNTTSRRYLNNAQTTLILDDCARRCIAGALNTKIRVVYDAPPAEKPLKPGHTPFHNRYPSERPTGGYRTSRTSKSHERRGHGAKKPLIKHHRGNR